MDGHAQTSTDHRCEAPDRRRPVGQALRNLVVAGNVLQELVRGRLNAATGDERRRMNDGIALWEIALEKVREEVRPGNDHEAGYRRDQ